MQVYTKRDSFVKRSGSIAVIALLNKTTVSRGRLWRSAFRVISCSVYLPASHVTVTNVYFILAFPSFFHVMPFAFPRTLVFVHRASHVCFYLPRRVAEGEKPPRERRYQRLGAIFSHREIFFRARQTRKETAIVAFQRAGSCKFNHP